MTIADAGFVLLGALNYGSAGLGIGGRYEFNFAGLAAPDIRSRIVDDGSEAIGSSPAQFRDFMSADLEKWARLVKQSGAKSE